MKCPKCQSDNPETLKFCGECGTQLPSAEDIQVSQTKTLETPIEELTRGALFAERYEIIEELGRGGMGKVYRVEDTSIKQEIALKLIKPEIASDKKTIERFSNELKNARMIAHRNVCRMFDLGKDKGAHYITMEYVPGEDLKSFIRRSGQLAVGTTIKIAKQVCEGLAEAHRVGVIHRDLKSNNIMIDKEGNARIMDFGIARSLKSKGLTGSGVMIGTPEYMSPEQVEGKEVDQRSDIYSLGIILYEMVTGSVPFAGDTPFTIGVKHKSEVPKSPKEINTNLPDDLSHVILRCLEKDKEKRYQSAGEMRSELENIEKGIPTTERIVAERKPITSREITVQFSMRKLFIPALIIIAIAVIGLILWSPWTKKTTSPIPSDKPSLAIAYFENNSGDESLNHWRSGLCEMLITDMSQSKFIHVISGDRVYSILERLNLLEKGKYSTNDLTRMATQGGATHVLRGSYMTAGDEFIINISLLKANTGDVISSIREEGKGEESIMGSIDRITQKVKLDLNLSQEQITADSDEEIEKITTSSPEAYKYYSEGSDIVRKAMNYRKAIPYFERAVGVDPEFAMAYRRMAALYGNISNRVKQGENIKKAFDLKEKGSDREHYLIMADFYRYEDDFEKSIEAFNKVLKSYPDDWVANNNLGVLYRDIGEVEKAIERYEANRQTGDDHVLTYSNLVDSYQYLGMYDKAVEILDHYLRNFSDNAVIHRNLATTYSIQGKYELALIEADKTIALNPMILSKGPIFHLQGDYDATEKEYKRWLEVDNNNWKYNGRRYLEILYRTLGQYEKAREQARKGLEFVDQLGNNSWKRQFHQILGYNHWSAGNYEEAMKEAEKVWASAVENQAEGYMRNILSLKALIYLEQGQTDKAQTVAEELKEKLEEMPNPRLIRDYYITQGVIEFKKKDYSKAIEYIEKGYSLLPEQHELLEPHAFYVYYMGLVNFQSGKLDKAKDAFDDIINMTTGRLWWGDLWAKSFYMLGKIHEQQNDTTKAIEYYEKFLDLWKDADAGIAEVEDTKTRLAKLQQ